MAMARHQHGVPSLLKRPFRCLVRWRLQALGTLRFGEFFVNDTFYVGEKNSSLLYSFVFHVFVLGIFYLASWP